MGRTLHITIKRENDTKFTTDELEIINSISNKYNSGNFARIWSCESFDPKIASFFGNWYGNKKDIIKLTIKHQLNNGDGYGFVAYINEKIEQLMQGKQITLAESYGSNGFVTYNQNKKKYTRLEATKFLVSEQWISFSDEKNVGKEIYEFVKVQGNEFNAMVVFLGCKEISLAIPKAEIEIYDEGEFLLSEIKMANGKAVPLISKTIEQMQVYALKMLFSKGFKGNILKKIKPNKFSHEFSMNLNIDNGYGDMTDYINDKLRNIKLIETRLSPLVKQSNELYTESLESRKKEDWFEPELFTRVSEINPKDFLDYKMSAKTLMDSGEQYYGLNTDVDPEAESYRRIGMIQKALTKIGMPTTAELEILGAK